MKNLIYYFTGTGNSLIIAKELAMQTDTQLLPATAVSTDELIKADSIGLVFPVYMLNAPRIIYSIVRKIRACSYCYIIMTMGGGSGKTREKIAAILSKNGIALNASFSIVMPDNYLVWYEAISLEKQMEATRDAKAKVQHIAGIIASRREHRDDERLLRHDINSGIPLVFKIIPGPLKQAFCDVGVKHIPEMDGSYLTTATCNGCGICSKVCPVHNISMNNKKPAWNRHCEQCFACLQWCPQEAIEYGKKSVGKKRYHHPDVTVKEMMEQALGGVKPVE